jgi:hypothetical protein
VLIWIIQNIYCVLSIAGKRGEKKERNSCYSGFHVEEFKQGVFLIISP